MALLQQDQRTQKLTSGKKKKINFLKYFENQEYKISSKSKRSISRGRNLVQLCLCWLEFCLFHNTKCRYMHSTVLLFLANTAFIRLLFDKLAFHPMFSLDLDIHYILSNLCMYLLMKASICNKYIVCISDYF